MREEALRHTFRCFGSRIASLIRGDRDLRQRLDKVEEQLGLAKPRRSHLYEWDDGEEERLELELLGEEQRT